MGYQDHAEATREFYRKQGEERERERIAKLLTERLGTGDIMKRSYTFGAVTFNGKGFYKTDK